MLVIGILSTIVLVGCQLYVTISVYAGLVHKLPGCDVALTENLRGTDVMCQWDWLLLFPGLLVLETEVIKHLPWGQTILNNATMPNGFPHKYFARVAYMAVLFEDFLQILLRRIVVVVIEGSDGWAITGAIAPLTLSASDLIVKTAFSFLMKARNFKLCACFKCIILYFSSKTLIALNFLFDCLVLEQILHGLIVKLKPIVHCKYRHS